MGIRRYNYLAKFNNGKPAKVAYYYYILLCEPPIVKYKKGGNNHD